MTQLSSSLAQSGLSGGPAAIYLLAACLCLLLALRFLGGAMAPIGPLVRAVAAVALVVLAVSAALAFLALALATLGGGLS